MNEHGTTIPAVAFDAIYNTARSTGRTLTRNDDVVQENLSVWLDPADEYPIVLIRGDR